MRLEQDHEPWIILRNARRLNDEESEVFTRIRIAKDLTPKQHEHGRELYNQLKEKREISEDGWYISRGQLVRGVGRVGAADRTTDAQPG